MEQQPRDESRAATVRAGGDESWTEAGELIDHPTNLPTSAGSREPTGDVPPGAGEAATGHSPTAPGTHRQSTSIDRPDPPTPAPAVSVESRTPGGADFSSSAAPAGQGSNTPIGGEPESFRRLGQPSARPGHARYGQHGQMPSLTAVGGMAAAATIGGLTYFWWRRRQARNTRTARMRAMLIVDLGASAGGELPRMIGQAAAQSRSAWLPLLLLPGRPLAARAWQGGRARQRPSCSSRWTSKSAASGWPGRAPTCSTPTAPHGPRGRSEPRPVAGAGRPGCSGRPPLAAPTGRTAGLDWQRDAEQRPARRPQPDDGA